jgi:prepilin-type N-terminal cleavage/methylation domain-containing protein
MMRTRQHTQPGYALVELMLVLTLLAIFLGIANELLMSCIHVRDDALRASRMVVQTDALIRLLRSDAWSASAIDAVGNNEIALQMSDGSTVRWRLHTDTVDEEITTWLTRTQVVNGQETAGDPLFAPEGIGFEGDGDNLYLVTESDRIRLPRAASLFEVNKL